VRSLADAAEQPMVPETGKRHHRRHERVYGSAALIAIREPKKDNLMKKIIAPLALAALSLSACGLNDVSKDDLRDTLTDDGIDEATANCVVDDLESQLSSDEFQEVAKADTFEEIDADLATRAEAIITACIVGG